MYLQRVGMVGRCRAHLLLSMRWPELHLVGSAHCLSRFTCSALLLDTSNLPEAHKFLEQAPTAAFVWKHHSQAAVCYLIGAGQASYWDWHVLADWAARSANLGKTWDGAARWVPFLQFLIKPRLQAQGCFQVLLWTLILIHRRHSHSAETRIPGTIEVVGSVFPCV